MFKRTDTHAVSSLEVVRAGAGSGKTTDLCKTVVTAVHDGLDPAKILATTFTRKAAAELKGRIQAALLRGDGNPTTKANSKANNKAKKVSPEHRQHAERLELAAIGTVHGVAHHLLEQYAIPMGLSPRLNVLTELAVSSSQRELLGMIDAESWSELTEIGTRLAFDRLADTILKLMEEKRTNRIGNDDFLKQMAASADQVCLLLAAHGSNPDAEPMEHLFQLADDTLTQLDQLTSDQTKVTQDAKQLLRRILTRRQSVWNNFTRVAQLEGGKRSGANNLLEPLRQFGASVRLHPGLHDDIRNFSNLLAQQVVQLESRYQEYKTARGLVDFTDLEILFLELLERSDLATALGRDYELILVDEFQDTNPLQLAIFEKLRPLAKRNRWVGDPKQAIYGFRGTDPQLVNEVWNHIDKHSRRSLDYNYRSQKGLVQLTGKLFAPVFGKEAVQKPKKPAKAKGVERWLLTPSPDKSGQNKTDDAMSLACGIAALHAEGVPYGDIAILERTNASLTTLAACCDELGIPYLLDTHGLLATREGAMVLAGLRLVADRNDSLAAAQILHLLDSSESETPDWFLERLKAVDEQYAKTPDEEKEKLKENRSMVLPWQDDDRFVALERIHRDLTPPAVIVQQVIDALNLPSRLAGWGDVARRGSHLDSLVKLATNYEETAFDAGQSATLTGLILHLESLAEMEQDKRHPSAGLDAVTLTTYHSAKGLEWPVVILSGLDTPRDPDMWQPLASGGDPDHHSPLEGRALQYWLWPFGYTEGSFPQRASGGGLEQDALDSAEGQIRCQQDREESLRLLYVGVTRAREKLVFAHREDRYGWLQLLPNVDEVLNCKRDPGEYPLKGIDTTLIVRKLNPSMAATYHQAPQKQITWLQSLPVDLPSSSIASQIASKSVSPIARYHSPSGVPEVNGTPLPRIEPLTRRSLFPERAKEQDYATIGDAVHAYLAALPSIKSLPAEKKLAVATRCLNAFLAGPFVKATDLVSSGDRFVQWVETRFGNATWFTEMHLSSPRAEGGQWVGTIDLLLELPNGDGVLIDHKSAPLRRDHCPAKAASYSGQLNAYREMLSTAGQNVVSTWIHFPLAGVMAECV